MTIAEISWLLAGAAVGGFVNGLAGFGTGLFALALFLNAMSPVQAVSVVLVLAIVGGVQGLWEIRTHAFKKPGRLATYLIPAIAGIPLGIYILTFADPNTLKLMIAIFLIVYGTYFSFNRRLPLMDGPSPRTDNLIGFLSGVLGGAVSLSGMLITIWCSLKPWPKTEIRSVIQVFNFTVLTITMIVLMIRGVYSQETLIMLLMALPVTLIFVRIGLMVYRSMSTQVFRRLLISLTYVSGIIILLNVLSQQFF